MKEKASFYLFFIIFIILGIVLINFAFPFFISIALENGKSLLLCFTEENMVISVVRHIIVLWTLIGFSLSIILLLMSQFITHKGFKKIGFWGRIIAIYSSVIIIFFFILIFFFSNAVHGKASCYYRIANFFINGFIH